jgi:hypothetical protein
MSPFVLFAARLKVYMESSTYKLIKEVQLNTVKNCHLHKTNLSKLGH